MTARCRATNPSPVFVNTLDQRECWCTLAACQHQARQQARCARLAEGADEVHQMRIAEILMRFYNETGSINGAVGGLPL